VASAAGDSFFLFAWRQAEPFILWAEIRLSPFCNPHWRLSSAEEEVNRQDAGQGDKNSHRKLRERSRQAELAPSNAIPDHSSEPPAEDAGGQPDPCQRRNAETA
jgi:hypothetical protein